MSVALVPQLLLNGIVQGLCIAALAVAFSVVYLPTRVFHIALAGLYVIAPYIAWSGARAGWPWPVAFGVGVMAVVAVSLVIELGNHGVLERRGAGPGAHFVTSLGISIVLVQAATLVWGSEVKTLAPGVQAPLTVGPVSVARAQALSAVVASALLGVYLGCLARTRLGLLLRAMAGNPRELALRGHDARRLRLGAFAVSGLLCGAVSILISLDTSLDPHSGFSWVLSAIVAVMIGGRGSFAGPALGGLLVGMVRSQTIWLLSARWSDAVTFGLLALGLLLMPEGILRGARRLEADRP